MRNNYPTRELVREVLEKPETRFVPHIGYVSLFPFMEKIIPPVSRMDNQMLKIPFYQFDRVLALVTICSMVRNHSCLSIDPGIMDSGKTA